jgi:glycerophosphoryl diester phosphodiesterase
MNIIEQSLIAKNPQKKSEDGLVVTSDFIAVIDGSTSKSKRRFHPFMSNGEYAMHIVAAYIRRMSPQNTCHQFCIGVTRAIQKIYTPIWKFHKADIIDRLKEHHEERLTASAVIFSRLRREIWLIGDCQCLIDGQFFDNPKPYEQTLAEMRATKVRELLAEGKTQEELLTNDEARDAIIPRMLQEMKNQNVTYSVIDGFRIPEQLVPVISLDFSPHEIVLASDGYPFLCPTLDESEAHLKHQRETDPLNIGDFKATKGFIPNNRSFDDRTYVRFTI